MAGLIEKDIRLMWCNKQALIFFLIIGVVIGLQNEAVILGWLPFAISILLINTVTYDELDKGYGFLMTLPIDAETYVREKYFFCLTGGTVSWLVAAGLYMILEMKQQMPVDMASQIPMVLVFLPVTALLIALLIPMQLIFGVEKSRVVISGACGVIGASVIAFVKLVKTNVLSAFSFLNQMNGWILAGIAVVVTVLLILLSYAISVRIMKKKEF
jgi:ABC-2 type transport system permease protein